MLVRSEKMRFDYTMPDDLDAVLAMEADEYNSRYVFSWSREKHQEAIDSPHYLHLALRGDGDGLLGYMILFRTEPPDNIIEFMRLVIGPKGKGYGREAIRLLKKLTFEVLKCHRLWLDVYEDNSSAIKLYLDEGFVQEGLLRECKWSPSGYRSMLIMSMLEDEYHQNTRCCQAVLAE